MKEYEYRRLTFYALKNQFEFEDEHKNFPIIQSLETIIADAVTYLTDGSSYLRFPGAARAVAISTAQIVSQYFNEDFFEVLNDPKLMNFNDPYFKTYSEDKKNYDEILKQCSQKQINWDSERMKITRKIIMEEYMLDDKGLKQLARNK